MRKKPFSGRGTAFLRDGGFLTGERLGIIMDKNQKMEDGA